MLACGRAETARRALVYLACTQEPDGGFAQNFWVDGRPYWSGVQLDEVAFPIILAWRLVEGQRPGRNGYLPLRGARRRVPGRACAHHPPGALGRERRLFAFHPGGGDHRADLRGGDHARAHDATELAEFLEEYADWIEGHLEDWTVTNDGVLHPEVKRHYMRIRPPETRRSLRLRELRQGDDPPQQPAAGHALRIRSARDHRRRLSGAGALRRAPRRRSADRGFAEGGRRGAEARTCRRDPAGCATTGTATATAPTAGRFYGWGQGRAWPLLTGERAHYELAAGQRHRAADPDI